MVGAVIVAAGESSRMGSLGDKQFLDLGGVPVIVRTLLSFEVHPEIDYFTAVIRPEQIERLRSIISASYGFKKLGSVVEGGPSRQHSVWSGIKALPQEVDVVVVHDGARPFFSQGLLSAVISKAYSFGAAAPGLPVTDTVKRVKEGKVVETVPRQGLWAFQTPQAFLRSVIEESYSYAWANGFVGTDDASLVEFLGLPVAVVEGEETNIKITTPRDFEIASYIWAGKASESRPKGLRVGIGYDIHRLAAGRPCVIGGVEIPCEFGLVGHSDGDVLTHAIMDALLGAVGKGDIGNQFPPSDQQYSGISSLKLLARVRKLVADLGFVLINIDSTVIAEKPRIMPYSNQIREELARILEVAPQAISVKATTNEGLGAIGKGEGIAAFAVALLWCA